MYTTLKYIRLPVGTLKQQKANFQLFRAGSKWSAADVVWNRPVAGWSADMIMMICLAPVASLFRPLDPPHVCVSYEWTTKWMNGRLSVCLAFNDPLRAVGFYGAKNAN